MGLIEQKTGMGAGTIWRQSGERWQKCREHGVGTCSVETEGCCAIVPCEICLEFDEYGEEIQNGIATYDAGVWSGTVGQLTFEAYWEKYEGVCRFVVVVNDSIVDETDKCDDDGAVCRTPSGSVDLQIEVYPDTIEGTLTWEAVEPRELPRRMDEDTECLVHFCGDCDCTCKKLCATISGANCVGTEVLLPGPDCDEEYWEGVVYWTGVVECGDDEYEVTVYLQRNDYDETCEVYAEVRGAVSIDTDPEPVTDCRDITATWSIDSYTTLSITCSDCGDCTDLPCVGCCFPYDIEGTLLNMQWEISDPDGACDAIDGETGIFTPVDPQGQAIGACGRCGCYITLSDYLEVSGQFPTGLEDPSNPGYCLFSPCTVTIQFALACVEEEETASGDACCSRIRLLARFNPAISQGSISGCLIFDGDLCGFNVDESAGPWVEISPTSCVCDGNGELLAEFSLSCLSIVCDSEISGGFCDGEPDCCVIACDLSDVTVSVSPA